MDEERTEEQRRPLGTTGRCVMVSWFGSYQGRPAWCATIEVDGVEGDYNTGPSREFAEGYIEDQFYYEYDDPDVEPMR